MTVLILCAAATWFMTGLHWFVQVVHYPLFASVGPDHFLAYHEEHSVRTTAVVFPAMTIELVTSAWLVAVQPDGPRGDPARLGRRLTATTPGYVTS